MDQARLASEYANLSSIYDPQRALVQQQVTALPGEYEAQKSALEQAKINAFRDIQNVAQSRGVSFSGFTPSEQASYTGTKYLPALASLSSQQNQAKYNLQKALLDIESQQRGQATSNLQNIMNREQQQAQFERQLALSRASAGSGGFTFNMGGNTPATTSTSAANYAGPRYEQTATGGLNFYNALGKPISALQYAQQSGQGADVKTFLQSLADMGDANAAIAVQYADKNFRNIPERYKSAINALGIGGTFIKPTPYNQPQAVNLWNTGGRR